MVAGFLATPLMAWADANPDFDDDAKPILKMQPGLLQYVESRFDVKDTGTAKYPGDDDHRPGPPFIFRARPLGSSGPYNLRLLIQPGAPGHILGVVDITKVRLNNPGNAQPPAMASQPAPEPQPPQVSQSPVQTPPSTTQPQYQQPPAPSASTSAPAAQPSEPTADTPSGPIMDSGSQGSSNNAQSSLAPPPDPAPPAQ